MNLSAAILTHETPIRLIAFGGLLAAFALLEAGFPRRARQMSRRGRWTANLGVSVVNSLLLRLVGPLAALGVAYAAQAKGLGLFNAVAAPDWLAILGSLIFLDMVIYFQHVAFHRSPLLWRIHRMHHTDLDLDVTSGVRFHPFEMLISLAIKGLAVLAIGAPPVAVILFEVILNGLAMFNHANMALPVRLDRWLRRMIVTPDMHRVHHSVLPAEHNHNFGFCLSLWDRLFATYQAQPKLGHDGMTIGLDDFPGPANLGLFRLLTVPFAGSQRRRVT